MTRIDKAIMLAAFLFCTVFSLSAQDAVWTLDGLSGIPIRSLAGAGGTTYAATDAGIYRSREPGAWTILPDSPEVAIRLVVDPTNPSVVYASSTVYSSAGLHKSTDAGNHFAKLELADYIHALAVDPSAPDTLYAGGDSVYRSVDGGRTFSEQPGTRALVARIAALVVDPNRLNHVYAGSDADYSFYYYAPLAPVLRTGNSGVDWTPALVQSWDAERSAFVQALAADARTGMLYAGSWDGAPWGYGYDKVGGSVFRSPDGGSTWERAMVDAGVNVLVADPDRPWTVYAGTDEGVLRSGDAGATWSPLAPGLPPGRVSALAIDPIRGTLHAGTEVGVYAISLPLGPCVPDTSDLCLLGGRFRASLQAFDPGSSRIGAGVAIRGGDRYGSFSLPGFTGDSTLPEVFVKMIDPGLDSSRRWVFWGGLTGLPYTLTVTDTLRGITETYRNDGESRFCGGVDGAAFFDEGNPWDYVLSGSGSRAEEAGGVLSLLGGRFSIRLSAYSPRHGRSEPGVAVAKTDRYGYFSLPGFTGDLSFPEVHVKMIDFRTITGDFALFHTGLTSLDYALTVTDQVTGEVRTFESLGDYCGTAVTLAAN